MPTVSASFDHVVVAAASLEQGIDYVGCKLGVAPVGGGRHRSEGTHNALLSLGPERYLEIIAIDPEADKPAKPRWFDLDSEPMQAGLSECPKLITWVARTSNLGAVLQRSLEPLGSVEALSRGPYRWQICRRIDGRLSAGGLIPLLIQWDSSNHPATALPDSGCSLLRLKGKHPDHERVLAGLTALGLADALDLEPSGDGDRVTLEAVIRCPRGEVALDR